MIAGNKSVTKWHIKGLFAGFYRCKYTIIFRYFEHPDKICFWPSAKMYVNTIVPNGLICPFSRSQTKKRTITG